jgi:hypothetical protein
MVKITFHTFSIGDPADPEIYAAMPLSEFMATEKGQWIKSNCLDPRYVIRPDARTFGQSVIVYGEVEEKSATEYFLRWNRA